MRYLVTARVRDGQRDALETTRSRTARLARLRCGRRIPARHVAGARAGPDGRVRWVETCFLRDAAAGRAALLGRFSSPSTASGTHTREASAATRTARSRGRAAIATVPNGSKLGCASKACASSRSVVHTFTVSSFVTRTENNERGTVNDQRPGFCSIAPLADSASNQPRRNGSEKL
jgi:hypothetical protein